MGTRSFPRRRSASVAGVRYDDDHGRGRSIRFAEWSVETGVSDIRIAPEATVVTSRREDVSAGDDLVIDDGGTVFEGTVVDAPVDQQGKVRLKRSPTASARSRRTLA